MNSYELIIKFVEWLSFRNREDLEYHISRDEFKVTWKDPKEKK